MVPGSRIQDFESCDLFLVLRSDLCSWFSVVFVFPGTYEFYYFLMPDIGSLFVLLFAPVVLCLFVDDF